MGCLPGHETDSYPSKYPSALWVWKSGRGIWLTMESSETRHLVYNLQIIPQNLKRSQPNIKASWSKAPRFFQMEFLLNSSSFQTEVQFFWNFSSAKYFIISALYLNLAAKQMSNLLSECNAIFFTRTNECSMTFFVESIWVYETQKKYEHYLCYKLLHAL